MAELLPTYPEIVTLTPLEYRRVSVIYSPVTGDWMTSMLQSMDGTMTSDAAFPAILLLSRSAQEGLSAVLHPVHANKY